MGLPFEQGKHRLRHCVLRPSRSRLQLIGVAAFIFIIYLLTPYDSPVRSFLRFQHNIVSDYLQYNFPSDKWLFRHQRYPIDLVQDVGYIVKSGYGTRTRVPKVLEALGKEDLNCDMLVVQDYPLLRNQNYSMPNGKHVPAVDIIGWTLDNNFLAGKERMERVTKYHHLAEAVEAEEWFVSDGLGKAIGWEMDALKFIPSLHYAWQFMPRKKWYVMADDDTYVIKESLNLLLGHLNPAKPQYLGNPIGDFKGRFAHGGSSAVISAAALSKLFDRHPDVVAEAYLESTVGIYGDKILSTTLMKLGVYLNEAYARLFNGENPQMTRMWGDRFCVPLIAFHGLGNIELMEQVGETFKNIREPVFWRQMGRIYGAADFETFAAEPLRVNQDFVGRLDEHSTSIDDVATPEDCLDICKQTSKCLAWTWEGGTRMCHYAPWAIVGDYHEGLVSGINADLAHKLSKECKSPPAPVSGLEAAAQ